MVAPPPALPVRPSSTAPAKSPACYGRGRSPPSGWQPSCGPPEWEDRSAAAPIDAVEPDDGGSMSIPEHSELGWAPISEVDPDLWSAMVRERTRQHDKIELIAS